MTGLVINIPAGIGAPHHIRDTGGMKAIGITTGGTATVGCVVAGEDNFGEPIRQVSAQKRASLIASSTKKQLNVNQCKDLFLHQR